MTAAPFILWAFSYASSPAQGAALVPGAQGSLSLAGGLNTNVPTLSLAATAGVTKGLDISLAYDTHAGIAHDVALSTRVRLTPGWAVSLDVTHAFFAVEEAFGIHTADAPFGNGVSSSPLLLASWFSEGGTHHWVGAGPSIRWIAVVDDFGTHERDFELTPRYLRFVVGAEWEGGAFLRFTANVPIEHEARALGFFPWIVYGTSWGLP